METNQQKLPSDAFDIIRNFIDGLETIFESDIPNIDLYMDQVTTFMDARLEPYKRDEEDKILTKAMINNYTKSKVLPVPNKKKYSQAQIEMLIALYHLKPILSLGDIHKLFMNMQTFGNKAEEAVAPETYEAANPSQPANAPENKTAPQAGEASENMLPFSAFYNAFTTQQENNKNHLKEEILYKIKKAQEAGFPDNEKSALMLLIISLALEASTSKRIAEKLIDLYL